jgi:uncharacterized protein YifE (UPF0438 family)
MNTNKINELLKNGRFKKAVLNIVQSKNTNINSAKTTGLLSRQTSSTASSNNQLKSALKLNSGQNSQVTQEKVVNDDNLPLNWRTQLTRNSQIYSQALTQSKKNEAKTKINNIWTKYIKKIIEPKLTTLNNQKEAVKLLYDISIDKSFALYIRSDAEKLLNSITRKSPNLMQHLNYLRAPVKFLSPGAQNKFLSAGKSVNSLVTWARGNTRQTNNHYKYLKNEKYKGNKDAQKKLENWFTRDFSEARSQLKGATRQIMLDESYQKLREINKQLEKNSIDKLAYTVGLNHPDKNMKTWYDNFLKQYDSLNRSGYNKTMFLKSARNVLTPLLKKEPPTAEELEATKRATVKKSLDNLIRFRPRNKTLLNYKKMINTGNIGKLEAAIKNYMENKEVKKGFFGREYLAKK